MKENYIVPLMTVFTVSPRRTLMTSTPSNAIADFGIVGSGDIDWDEE